MELQQDAQDEAFRRHKKYFQEFLENEVSRSRRRDEVRTPSNMCALHLH
jgi:hypothetical protein